jgi:hypothetical protein
LWCGIRVASYGVVGMVEKEIFLSLWVYTIHLRRWMSGIILDPLDWDYDELEDPALALLDAIEEDFLKEAKDARAKYKSTRELLNLKSSVNYGDVITSNWRREGKVQGRQR